MQTVINSGQFYDALAKAIDLPRENVIEATIRMTGGGPVVIQCEILVPSVDTKSLVRAMRSFRLVDLSEPATIRHEAEAVGFDVWMRDRTEQAHQEYMHRTRHLPV